MQEKHIGCQGDLNLPCKKSSPTLKNLGTLEILSLKINDQEERKWHVSGFHPPFPSFLQGWEVSSGLEGLNSPVSHFSVETFYIKGNAGFSSVFLAVF